MRAFGVAVLASASFLVPPALPQTADWSKVLHDLVNRENPAVKAAAAKQFFETLLPILQTESAISLEKDIRSIALLLNDQDAEIRVQASGVLYTLTVVRQDTAETLKAAFSALSSHFQDSAARVRGNVARTVAGLKPNIPHEALSMLIGSSHDKDPEVRGASIYGIARTASQSQDARQALLSLLREPDVTIQLEVLRDIGFGKVQDSSIVARLRQLLTAKDPPIVKATIDALANLGSGAAPARPELERIVQDGTDKEITRAAATVIANIDRH